MIVKGLFGEMRERKQGARLDGGEPSLALTSLSLQFPFRGKKTAKSKEVKGARLAEPLCSLSQSSVRLPLAHHGTGKAIREISVAAGFGEARSGHPKSD